MIRKSVPRFSEKIMLKQQPKRDDDSSNLIALYSFGRNTRSTRLRA